MLLFIHFLTTGNYFSWHPVGSSLTDASVVMVTHRLLSSAMHSSDDSDWPAHSLILSFHDFRILVLWWTPSNFPCSIFFGSKNHLFSVHVVKTKTGRLWKCCIFTKLLLCESLFFCRIFVVIIVAILQIGGSDQLGNIVSGYELVTRVANRQVFGNISILFLFGTLCM